MDSLDRGPPVEQAAASIDAANATISFIVFIDPPLRRIVTTASASNGGLGHMALKIRRARRGFRRGSASAASRPALPSRRAGREGPRPGAAPAYAPKDAANSKPTSCD